MKLAIGTAQFGMQYGIANQIGRVDLLEIKKILDSARSRGVDTLDTAILYGKSEQILGDVGVTDFQVVSKLPAVPSDCTDVASWVVSQVRNSLDRLKISQLYALLLHVPSQLQTSVQAPLILGLKRCQAEGLIHKIGVSVYEPADLNIYLDYMDIEIVQIPLNLLDRRFIESGSIKKLQVSGIEVHARSAFLQGLMLMSLEDQKKLFPLWRQTWEYWHQWLLQENLSAKEACLRFALSVQDVARTVIGVDSHEHFTEISTMPNYALRALPEWPQLITKELINPSLWSAVQ